MRVLVCGSRGWTDYKFMLHELSLLPHDNLTIIEGCARGADRLAERAAKELGAQIEHHPADWATYGRSAGFKRNIQMLESNIDLVLAFWDGTSRGTAHTIREAKARHIDITVNTQGG